MRRLSALLLIAVSGWLLYQTMWRVGGFQEPDLLKVFERELGSPTFFFPALGGAFGFLGGLIALVGGPGGAIIALIGGVIAAGFALYGGTPVWTADGIFWMNPTIISIAMLPMAGAVAILGRR